VSGATAGGGVRRGTGIGRAAGISIAESTSTIRKGSGVSAFLAAERISDPVGPLDGSVEQPVVKTPSPKRIAVVGSVLPRRGPRKKTIYEQIPKKKTFFAPQQYHRPRTERNSPGKPAG
jgi:hypothetical protein